MKAKLINNVRIEGLLYQHDLKLREAGPHSKNPGVKFISGTIEVATDNAITNIIPVHFTYVVPLTSKGTENATYNTLKGIIDGKFGCYTNPDVTTNAAKVRVDTAIGLNEFYSDRSGTEELISVKRCEGGFVHVVQSISENENQRNTFDVDIVIVGVKEKEAVENDSGEIISPEKAIIEGRIFNFRKDMLPVTFSAINPQAIDYFMGLGASLKEPVFTKIKGQIISQQGVRYIKEESAFGDCSVREVPTSNKDYVVTWAAPAPYEFDLEDTMTFEDLKAAAQARENTLAELKRRREEYKASQGSSSRATTSGIGEMPIKNNDFVF